MVEPLVQIRSLFKEYSGNPVLKGVNLAIRRGSVLGLIGENGAGKSTFVKILSGIVAPTSGTVDLDGVPVSFRLPSEARAAGISLVPQEFNLASDLSVEENVFLGAEKTKNGTLDRPAMLERTAALLSELGASVSPHDRIHRLSAAQKQLVEVSKALAFDARLLILDEPTTMLTTIEINRLFAVMRSLKEHGMTQIYVSHKLSEVKEICDDVAVLKDGELVHFGPAADLRPDQMARLMVGRELKEIYPSRVAPRPEIALEVRDFASPDAFSGVSLSLHRGEILGFSGLVGSGRTETAEALMGLRPHTGTIVVDGQEAVIRNAADAFRLGLGYLSEDRQGSGILTDFGIAENMTLGSLKSYLGWFTIDKAKEETAALSWRDRFSIKAAHLGARTESLSGGNQQKVSLAKTLDPGPRVVIVDEPTRGVDIAAKQEIYQFLAELAAEGTAILLISSEMEEILGLCSRVVVLREGRLAGELSGSSLTEERIMELATGLSEGASA